MKAMEAEIKKLNAVASASGSTLQKEAVVN
jgi:hypothetical protein